MKRSRYSYFLACAVSVFASTSVILGQGAVSFGLNLSPVDQPLPDGAAAAFGARSSSGIFAGIATVRPPTPNPGWSGGTSDRPGLFLAPGFPLPGDLVIGNMPFVTLILPDVVASRPSDSFLTVRPWDSSGSTDFSQAGSPAGQLFIVFDRPSSGLTFQAQPWGGTATGGVSIQDATHRRGGASFPPIPPLPANRESGLVVVPEPGTWVLMGVGTMTLLLVRRRPPPR